MDKVKENANKVFSAGLGKVCEIGGRVIITTLQLTYSGSNFVQGGRAAAWATAFAVVAAWSWYENRDNGQIFSKEEQQKWNSQKDSKTGKST